VCVAGHGVQLTKAGSVILLEDFASEEHLNQLEGAIDMAGVHAGMIHDQTAQTQFLFIDACRQKPKIARKFESLTGAISLDEPNNGVAQVSPLYQSTVPGNVAYGKPNGVSLFNEALMWSLREAAAAVGPDDELNHWHISVTSLIKRLPEKVQQLASDYEATQSVGVTGKIQEAVFHFYLNTPKVTIKINLLPSEAQNTSQAILSNFDESAVYTNLQKWPLNHSLDAGLYTLKINSEDPFNNYKKIINLTSPRFEISVKVDE